ncbi:MAG: Stk1 family PASTA domain-containing Ser/Thr kinase [Marmoricola sp.]
MEQPPADRGSDPFIGRLLNHRYRIDKRIARGGMATVYESFDTRLDRTVAVKIMHPGMSGDEQFARRFEREAQSAARLSHHNVVQVFDRGEDDGTLYLVMEYVPGRTMRDLIRAEAPVSAQRAMALMDPVLVAIAAAHKRKLIHRDIKPENILLGADDSTKVADFGLAKAITSETNASATTGSLMGTVSYLSPEFLADGYADERADVYAAGVMIYELMTGVKPHRAEGPIQVAYKHVNEDTPPPSEMVEGVPDYVDALVAGATARDMSLRPPDANALLTNVRRVASALERGIASDRRLADELSPHVGTPIEPTISAPVVPAPTHLGTAAPLDLTDVVYDQEEQEAAEEAWEPNWNVGPDPTREPTPEVAPEPAAPDVAPEPAVPAIALPRARAATFTPASKRRISAQRRRRLIVAALVALGLLIAGYWLLVARYTHTPSVLRLTQSAATAKVKEAGLSLKVGGYDYSESVPKDTVIRTTPEPGDRILDGGTVVAVLSRGPERHAVPNLVGKSLEDAQKLLDSAALATGTITKTFSETVAAGKVIKTTPQAGIELRRDAVVDLVVSKGRQPVKIPDFTNKLAAKASLALTKLGFVIKRTAAFSDTVPAGKVISQTPNSGTGFKGDSISLEVSKGPELVAVPNVKKMGVAAAKQALRAAGFKVVAVKSKVWIGLGYVLKSDPVGGSMAPKGRTVTIYLV